MYVSDRLQVQREKRQRADSKTEIQECIHILSLCICMSLYDS